MGLDIDNGVTTNPTTSNNPPHSPEPEFSGSIDKWLTLSSPILPVVQNRFERIPEATEDTDEESGSDDSMPDTSDQSSNVQKNGKRTQRSPTPDIQLKKKKNRDRIK